MNASPGKSSALAYLRRSRVDDAHLGAASHDAQLAAVRDLAYRHGCDELEILEDWRRSGGAGKEHLHPGHQQLGEAIDGGTVRDVFSLSGAQWSGVSGLSANGSTGCDDHASAARRSHPPQDN
jgi:hypothetical protein